MPTKNTTQPPKLAQLFALLLSLNQETNVSVLILSPNPVTTVFAVVNIKLNQETPVNVKPHTNQLTANVNVKPLTPKLMANVLAHLHSLKLKTHALVKLHS